MLGTLFRFRSFTMLLLAMLPNAMDAQNLRGGTQDATSYKRVPTALNERKRF